MSQLVRNVGLVGYKQLGPGLWPLLLFHSPLVRRTREIAFRMWAHKSVESSLAKQLKSSPAYRGFGRTCLTVTDREKGYIHHQHTAVFFHLWKITSGLFNFVFVKLLHCNLQSEVIFRLKMHKKHFASDRAMPGPTGGAYSTLPDPLAAFLWPIFVSSGM